MNKIDIKEDAVCSLGILCHTSELLKRNNIRKCSYPFDWTFSDWLIVSKCLEDGFEKFLDKTLFSEPVCKFTDRQCGHKLYHQDFFFHKNPKDREDDFEYYKRCIARFNALMKREEPKLFVLLAVPYGTNEPALISDLINQNKTEQEIVDFYKLEMQKFVQTLECHTSNFTLLSIINFPEHAEQKFVVDNAEKNLHLMQLYTKSKSNGKHFIDEEDNVFLDNAIKTLYNFY